MADDTHVLFEGKKWHLSPLAQRLLGKRSPVQGPLWFTHDGETLADLRTEAESGVA